MLSKSNQAIKFGQLIKHNMTKNLLEKSFIKCGEETIPIPFSKISELTLHKK